MLPGATERLLQATKAQHDESDKKWVDYLALSVQYSAGRGWSVHLTKLDRGTGRVVAERLDGDDSLAQLTLTKEEMIRYWAHEIVLRSLQDGLW